jgi:hypothetical protein
MPKADRHGRHQPGRRAIVVATAAATGAKGYDKATASQEAKIAPHAQ